MQSSYDTIHKKMEYFMKKTLLLTTALVLSSTLFASDCKYNAHSSSLTWTAFKTPAKVGVKGTFNDIKFNSTTADSLEKLLNSSSVKITTANVNSNNEGRDAKLVNNFFNVQGVSNISAKVLSISEKTAKVEITMNNVKKVIPMNIVYFENVIKLKGAIDLAEFKMLPSLESITKACYELHQGKTWQDVELEFTITTSCDVRG